jgi:hypothetical protein
VRLLDDGEPNSHFQPGSVLADFSADGKNFNVYVKLANDTWLLVAPEGPVRLPLPYRSVVLGMDTLRHGPLYVVLEMTTEGAIDQRGLLVDLDADRVIL